MLKRAQTPWNNTGEDAHVSPTPRVILREDDITPHTLEAACWLEMRCWTNNVAKSHLSPSPFNSRVLRSCLVCNAHTCLIDFVINDTLRTVTGCLQPTPGDNHLIFANIQPADVCYKVTILHTILWSLEGCSTQCSFIHRVRMHGIPNRDIYWYTPHSNSSVHPRTATEAQ